MGDRLPHARMGGECSEHSHSMRPSPMDCLTGSGAWLRRLTGSRLTTRPQARGPRPRRSSVAIEARCWPLCAARACERRRSPSSTGADPLGEPPLGQPELSPAQRSPGGRSPRRDRGGARSTAGTAALRARRRPTRLATRSADGAAWVVLARRGYAGGMASPCDRPRSLPDLITCYGAFLARRAAAAGGVGASDARAEVLEARAGERRSRARGPGRCPFGTCAGRTIRLPERR